MAGAAIEWLSGVIRVSQRDDFRHGDPDWHTAVTVTRSIDGVAELSALPGDLTLADHTALGRLLWGLGFKRVRWLRKRATGDEIKEFDLTRFSERKNTMADGEKNDVLEITVVRKFAGDTDDKPGMKIVGTWRGNAKNNDALEAILGIKIGEAFRAAQEQKESK